MFNVYPKNGAHSPIIKFQWNSPYYAIKIIPFKSFKCQRGRAKKGQIKCKNNHQDNRISDIWKINVSDIETERTVAGSEESEDK